VPCYNPKAERDCRSRSMAELAEAGSTYCFMLLSVCPRVCRQSTAYGLCCFGKPFSSLLGPVATAITASTYSGLQSAARTTSPRSATARLSRGVRSSHSQQHCAQVEAHLLKDILTWCIFVLFVILFSGMKNSSRRSKLQLDVIILWSHYRV
jgi:hypothetical protein